MIIVGLCVPSDVRRDKVIFNNARKCSLGSRRKDTIKSYQKAAILPSLSFSQRAADRRRLLTRSRERKRFTGLQPNRARQAISTSQSHGGTIVRRRMCGFVWILFNPSSHVNARSNDSPADSHTLSLYGPYGYANETIRVFNNATRSRELPPTSSDSS